MLDLLAVTAMIFLLLAVVSPVLSRTKPTGQGIQCLSNLKRLVNVWQMYPQDNNDMLANSYHGGNAQGGNFDPALGPGWAAGWLDWTTSTDNTNSAFLLNARYSTFAQYLSGRAALFKCPADIFLSSSQRSRAWAQRVRSYSISMGLGQGNAEAGPWDQTYAHVNKISELRFPAPAETWVFLEEHPDSMNDPGFFNPHLNAFVDYPARYHNGATSFAFADGHVELQPWRGAFASRRGAEVHYAWDFSEVAPPGDPDIHWMSYHAQRRTSSSH